MIVGALTLYFLCNLKASQMNVQRGLIQENMLYKFDEGHNAVKATKKRNCKAKDEGTVDHNTVTRLLIKFRSVYNNFKDKARSDGR